MLIEAGGRRYLARALAARSSSNPIALSQVDALATLSWRAEMAGRGKNITRPGSNSF